MENTMTPEWKEKLKIEAEAWLKTLGQQIFGYKLSPLQKHILRERLKQFKPYRGFKTFNAYIRHRDKHWCYLCKGYIQFGESNVEHDLPLGRWGYTDEKNCHDSHQRCNKAKGLMTAEQYWRTL